MSADRSASQTVQSTSADEARHKTLDRSCGISDTTTQFGAILPGGRLVKLDDASNAKVAQEIRNNSSFSSGSSSDFSSAASDNKKIYRVTIGGTMEGDMLHVESVQQR